MFSWKHVYTEGSIFHRHGYEQPIFTYPSIRAIEAIQALDMDALFRINLYAIFLSG
jgi:hypothetical protein